MIETLKKRIAREESGFTLIELLVVIIILGILLAIAVPSYLGLKDRANKAAAMSNIRSLVPDIEQYNADNNGYTGIGSDASSLTQYDQSLVATHYTFVTGDTSATDYCVYTQSGAWYGYKHGPSGVIAATKSVPAAGSNGC